LGAEPRRVLVTGAPAISAATPADLASRGYQPVVFDNLGAGHRAAVQCGDLVEGDILDTATVREAIRRYGIRRSALRGLLDVANRSASRRATTATTSAAR
jgi:UDP-glucose 4-epimerase